MATKPLKGLKHHRFSVMAETSKHVVGKRRLGTKVYYIEVTGSNGGHIVRQMGVAKAFNTYPGKEQFVLFTHSQITNDPSYPGGPAMILTLDREDLEALVTMGLQMLAE